MESMSSTVQGSSLFARALVGRALAVQALGVTIAAATAMLVAAGAAVAPVYTVKTVMVSGAIALLVMASVRAGHPFARFGAANSVTTIRAAIVAAAAGLVGEVPSTPVAAAAATLAVVAVALDGVDGWLARRTRMISPFGARFDMEVDAFLILVLAVLAWTHGKAGAWVVLAGAMRYLFVAAGTIWHWAAAPLPPSTRRKAVCVLQVVGLAVVVSPFLGSPASVIVAFLTVAMLTWSFAVDTVWLRRHIV
jgi:phosphatidylglycerophosphate synthase